jgi:uncharacterized protein YdeI (YjbR/CyaY-like superfamily)
MNSKVDLYLEEGCGRCSFYRTPQCKVNDWAEELKHLRRIVLECGLDEAYKWSQPCYVYRNSHVLLVTAFIEYAAISFFKGALLADSDGILVAPGPNSQSARQIRFTNLKDILERESVLEAYIYEAIEVEKLGLKVNYKRKPEAIPDELKKKFKEIPALKSAFEALTPGRQRGYILHFSQPKQSKTRESRIEKSMEKIFSGKGINDR